MDYTVNCQQLGPPAQQDFSAKWLLSVPFLPWPNMGTELEVAFSWVPGMPQTSTLPAKFGCLHSSV